MSHIAVSSEGRNRGSDNSNESRIGEGAKSGDTKGIASEIASEVVEVGSQAGGLEAGEGSRRVSSREPRAAVMAGESLGLLSEEQERDISTAQGVSGERELVPLELRRH